MATSTENASSAPSAHDGDAVTTAANDEGHVDAKENGEGDWRGDGRLEVLEALGRVGDEGLELLVVEGLHARGE